MIISKVIEIPKTSDNVQIEDTLRAAGIEPIRWAITEATEHNYKITVSYIVR